LSPERNRRNDGATEDKWGTNKKPVEDLRSQEAPSGVKRSVTKKGEDSLSGALLVEIRHKCEYERHKSGLSLGEQGGAKSE